MTNLTKIFVPLLVFVLMTTISCADIVSPSGMNPLPFISSADQYYRVMFDGEGEALVILRMAINNKEDQAIQNVNVEIPTDQPVYLYGVIQEGYTTTEACDYYIDGCVQYGDGSTCIEYDWNGNCINEQRPCLQYGQVCHQYVTRGGVHGYDKLIVTAVPQGSSILLPIQLSNAVPVGGQTTLLIMYKTESYAEKSLGAWKFSFETAKVPYASNTVRVAVNVQPGLYLKGTKENVNYAPNFMLMEKAMSSMSVQDSATIDSFSNEIMRASGYVKTTSLLDPYESYTVEGKYSSSWLTVYIWKILGVLIVIGILVWLIVHVVKRLHLYSEDHIKKKENGPHTFLIPFIGGLIGAVSILLLYAIVYLLSFLFKQSMGYSSAGMWTFLAGLLATLIGLGILIGSGVYTGTKYGPAVGLFTVLSIFVWIFIFVIILGIAVGIVH